MEEGRDNILVLENGRKVGYAEYGTPKGNPLFYLHGWPGCRLSGAETDQAAKKLGIWVISIDRPGYGLSDFRPDSTFLNWTDDLIAVADELGVKKFAVMGVSGGGPYAAACAYRLPDRLTRVGIVVGLGPTHIPGILAGLPLMSHLAWANYHRLPTLRTLATWNAMLQFKYLSSLGFFLSFRSTEDRHLLKTKLHAAIKNTTREAFRQGIRGPAHDLQLYTDDWGFKLSDIKTKVYLWYGIKDKNVTLAMGQYYASQIPGSRLFIDPSGSHLSRTLHEADILKTLTS